MNKLLIAILLSGCAASQPSPRGPVVTSVSRESQVCLDRGLAVGEQLRFARQTCHWVPPKNLRYVCEDEPVATAEVVRVTDDHCAVLRLPESNELRPGDRVVLAHN